MIGASGWTRTRDLVLARACWWRRARYLVVLVAIAAMACAPQVPWRVGFLGGLSGRVSDVGLAGRDGARLAVEHINARGGIAGRQVDLIVRDDAQTPEQAQRAVNELIAAGVELIIGPMTSAMAAAALPAANAAGVMLVSPTVQGSGFSHLDDNFVRVSSASGEYAAEAARFVARERGLRRAAIIFDMDNEAFTVDWGQFFASEFVAQGGVVVHTERYDAASAPSLQEHVERMLGASPDLLIIVATVVDVARIAQLVRRVDSSVTLLGSSWAGTEQLLAIGGSAVEGMLVPQLFDRDDQSAAYSAFRAEYRARFGEAPGFVAVAAYDATHLALDSLERAGGGSKIKAALVNRAFDGLQQRIEIDNFGDSRRKIHMMSVRDGHFRREESRAAAVQ